MKKVGSLLAIIAALIGILACSGDSSTASEDVVLRMIDAVNSRDFDALDKVVALDVRRHSGATPDVTVESLADFKAFLHQDLAAVPDAVQEVNLIFSSGPFVGVHMTYSGTQTGPMGPFPASNRHLELPFIGILRVEDGKIVEIWVEWDNLNALSQLGHFPPTDSDPAGEQANS